MENKRGQWGSSFGFLMAAIGSAVGLGNIWGFPYKMGKSGGFAFLVIYLVLVALVGIVVMLGELTLLYPITPPALTGEYDDATKQAVREIQALLGLMQDGRTDILTWNAIANRFNALPAGSEAE